LSSELSVVIGKQ